MIAAAVLMVAAAVGAYGTGRAMAEARNVVSQKSKDFNPKNLQIKRNDVVTFANDETSMDHHAYTDTPEFSFDIGDQSPGERTQVAFPVAGTFTVMCGIHPTMKMKIQVDE